MRRGRCGRCPPSSLPGARSRRAAAVGVGTPARRWGCRGFIGPVPQPLWMRSPPLYSNLEVTCQWAMRLFSMHSIVLFYVSIRRHITPDGPAASRCSRSRREYRPRGRHRIEIERSTRVRPTGGAPPSTQGLPPDDEAAHLPELGRLVVDLLPVYRSDGERDDCDSPYPLAVSPPYRNGDRPARSSIRRGSPLRETHPVIGSRVGIGWWPWRFSSHSSPAARRSCHMATAEAQQAPRNWVVSRIASGTLSPLDPLKPPGSRERLGWSSSASRRALLRDSGPSRRALRRGAALGRRLGMRG